MSSIITINFRIIFGNVLVACTLLWATPAVSVEVVTEYQGKKLNGNLEIVEGKSFADGVILIFHAMMQHRDSEIIQGLQNGFKDSGRNSLAVNLSMGLDDRHGSFECSEPHRYLFDDAFSEGLAWLEWLNTQGAGPVAILGHSLGANQALGLVVDHPESQIAALILLSPMTTGHEKLLSAYEKRWRTDFDPIFDAAKNHIDRGNGGQLMQVDFVFCPKAQVTARTFVNFYGGRPLRYDPSGYLRKLQTPTQIIVGSADDRQPNVTTFLKPFVDDEKIFMYTIESGGHFFRDLNLEEAVEVAVEFLDGL